MRRAEEAIPERPWTLSALRCCPQTASSRRPSHGILRVVTPDESVSHAPSIRTFASREWRSYRDLWLAALVDSPDAFGRTLAEEQQLSDEDWSARLSSGSTSATDLPLVAELENEAVGLAWGRIEPSESQTAHLYQMWVAPSVRSVGAGRLLVDAVSAWARSVGALRVALGVTCGDTPATRLYQRAGFEPVGDPQPIRPGSPLLGQEMILELEVTRSEDSD